MKLATFAVITAAVVGAGAWLGKAVWCAHKDLVTLHVRNAPLAEVIRSLQRQTREQIIADGRLDTRITLDADRKPLVEVLDRLGDQAGALASTIHAVHTSRGTVHKLEAALRAGDVTQAEGWTNLSPRLMIMTDDGPPPARAQQDASGPDAGGDRHVVTVDRQVIVRQGPDGKPVVVQDGSTPTIWMGRRGAGDGGAVVKAAIVPERIMIETPLARRFDREPPPRPNREGALNAARKVNGSCTTWYALQKSPLGDLPPGAMRRLRFDFSGPGSGHPGGTNVKIIRGLGPQIEDEAGRADLSRFRELTPEQRAARAREAAQRKAND
jgi:hypothetical protein